MNGISVEEDKDEEETASLFDRWFFGGYGGLNEGCEVGVKDNNGLSGLLVGGGVGGGGGGKICGGSGGGSGTNGGGDESSGFWDSNSGNASTDVYYRKMIEANPGNPLLLSNYARFLKEVYITCKTEKTFCFCDFIFF